MISTIILTIASVVFLYFSLVRNDKKSIGLTGGLALSFFIIWLNESWAYSVSAWLYFIFAIIIGLSALKEKEASKMDKALVMCFGFWAAISKLSQIEAWPYAYEMTTSMAIPFLLYLLVFRPKYRPKKELDYINLLMLSMWLRVILY